jgi:hypothetical protein
VSEARTDHPTLDELASARTAGRMPAILRRAAWLILLLLLGFTAALLVARLPSDPDRRIVTRRHHNSDPLLNATLLQFNVTSLLHHPTRYFAPPILFPDPNPYRSTEPLIAEALLAIPFRLVLGHHPALVYTAVLIATLALVAVFTGLLLLELGVRPSLALVGGSLSVLVATTTVFVDRLQSVSIQWLPLGIVFALRFWRRGRPASVVAFAACSFLTVQASLYTAVMLLAATLFLWPAALTLRRERQAGSRAAVLALALVAAATFCLLVLQPYLRGREDVAAYASAAFAPHKPWGQAFVADLVMSPPEYGQLGWPLEPWVSWDGVYPGTAFILLVVVLAALSLARRLAAGAPPPDADAVSRVFQLSKRLLVLLLLALAGAVVWSAIFPGSSAARDTCDLLLWSALTTWCARLALWPATGTNDATRLALLASTAWLAALVLFLLSLGSPIQLTATDPPLLQGVFAPLSRLMPPLRELRELKRFLMPAGWAAVVAATLSLERRLSRQPHGLAPAIAALLLALGLGERLQADTRGINVPPPPEMYALLASSETQGGLLELPFDPWGQISSVKRMLWQPEHGRPIVAGKGGLDPAWYTPAGEVFEEFPSEESVRLLGAWGIGAVLDGRPDAWREPLPRMLPGGLVLRAVRERPEGAWRLFDVLPLATLGLPPEPEPGAGHWTTPSASPTPSTPTAGLAVDGSLETAAAVRGAEGLVLEWPGPVPVTAVLLDYGPGRFSRVPKRLAVQGEVGGEWKDLALEPTAALLRARAADQLLRQRSARLLIALRPNRVSRLRLVSDGGAWDLPELRLRLAGP